MFAFHVNCQGVCCVSVCASRPVTFSLFYLNVLFIHNTLPANDIVNAAFPCIQRPFRLLLSDVVQQFTEI